VRRGLVLLLLALSGCGVDDPVRSRSARIGQIGAWAERRGVSYQEAFSNEHYQKELP
jgi:hypothetical protein